MLHPDHLRRRLSASQLNGWRNYYAIEPWGFNLLDQRIAAFQRDFINMNRDREKHPEPFELHDFCTYLEQPESIIDLGPEANEQLIIAQMDSCVGG